MPWSEILFGSLLVMVLLLLAIVFGWRQLVQLRRLRSTNLPAEESAYERHKAIRRLLSCGILLVLGVMLAGLLAIFEPPMQRLTDKIDSFPKENKPPLSDEEKALTKVWGWLVVAMLVLLLLVVALAGADLLATRRHALRLFRKLQADRRAMIQRQTIRMRQEREEPE